MTLTVSDDGRGFDPNRIGASGGLGLINMRERARQLSGMFELNSEPGRGVGADGNRGYQSPRLSRKPLQHDDGLVILGHPSSTKLRYCLNKLHTEGVRRPGVHRSS